MTEIDDLLRWLESGENGQLDWLTNDAADTIRQLQSDLAAAKEANASEFKRGQEVMRDAAVLAIRNEMQFCSSIAYDGTHEFNLVPERVECASCIRALEYIIFLDDKP
jgi:hypothetical protein